MAPSPYRYRVVDSTGIVLESRRPLRDRRSARQTRRWWAKTYPRRSFRIERTSGRGWERVS